MFFVRPLLNNVSISACMDAVRFEPCAMVRMLIRHLLPDLYESHNL